MIEVFDRSVSLSVNGQRTAAICSFSGAATPVEPSKYVLLRHAEILIPDKLHCGHDVFSRIVDLACNGTPETVKGSVVLVLKACSFLCLAKSAVKRRPSVHTPLFINPLRSLGVETKEHPGSCVL